jgi:hypothetical protein
MKHLMRPKAMLASQFLATDVASDDFVSSMNLDDMQLSSHSVLHNFLANRTLVLHNRVAVLLLDGYLGVFHQFGDVLTDLVTEDMQGKCTGSICLELALVAFVPVFWLIRHACLAVFEGCVLAFLIALICDFSNTFFHLRLELAESLSNMVECNAVD